MNKFRTILALLVIQSVLLSAGCGGDDKNPTNPGENVPTELVGTWLYESVTVNGVPFSLGFVLGWDPGTVAARFTVGTDGSFVYEELDSDSTVVWSEWGTFTVSGSNATITVTENDDGPVDPPQVLSGAWALNGDALTLTTTYQGATAIFIATRY